MSDKYPAWLAQVKDQVAKLDGEFNRPVDWRAYYNNGYEPYTAAYEQLRKTDPADQARGEEPRELADRYKAGEVDLAAAVRYHLLYNHYPSYAAELVDPAVYAINEWSAGRTDTPIDLTAYNLSVGIVLAQQLIDDCHLWGFVTAHQAAKC